MANNGYLDDLDIKKVKDAEIELFQTIDSEYTQLIEKMLQEGLTEDIKEQMHEVCKKVKSKL